jgi:hypothetical protein
VRLFDRDVSDHVYELNKHLVLPSAAKHHSKYGNVPCTFDGLRFDSKAEMARYGDLRLLQMTGHISNLTTQPVFELAGKVKYKGDFQYTENGRTICEDVKGFQTDVFKLKWKQAIERYPDVEFRLVVS